MQIDSRASTATSKTTTSIVNGSQKRAILEGKYGFWDFLFPFFDVMTQDTEIWSIFYYLVLIYIIGQYVLLSTWPRSNDKIENNGTAYDICVSIFLYTGGESGKNLQPCFLIIIIVFGIILISAILQFLSYLKSRVFVKSIMIVLRFVCECFTPAALVPTAAFAGWSMQLFIDGGNKVILVLSIISIVIFIAEAIIFSLFYQIFSITPFLQRSFLATWSSKSFCMMQIVQALFGFVDSFVINFPDFMRIIITTLL